MSNREVYGIVMPGEGVTVEKINVAPVRTELEAGTFVLDEAQQHIGAALNDPSATEAEAKDVLNLPPNKKFKIAYTSLLMDQVWNSYSKLALGGGPVIYTLHFDGVQPVLEVQPGSSAASLPLPETADQIAASNQAMMTYGACLLLGNGKMPVICGDAEQDTRYYNAFREQTELQISRTRHYFTTVPEHLDAPSRFIASGLQSIRTHVFGIPNLLDGVSADEGITLTADQHRRGTSVTYRKSIRPYFYPTGPLMMAIDSGFADPETQQLLPERWIGNGDPDNYLVYPKPEIVRAGNMAMSERSSLPAQTGCPVVHSRVTNNETADSDIPFTLALGKVLLRQLDALYYPQRQQYAMEGADL